MVPSCRLSLAQSLSFSAIPCMVCLSLCLFHSCLCICVGLSISFSLSVSFPSLLLPLPSCQSLSHPSLSPASFFPSSLSLFSYLSFSCLSPPLALSPCFSIFATLHPFSLSLSFRLCPCLSLCLLLSPTLTSSHHLPTPVLACHDGAYPLPLPAEAESCVHLRGIKVL